MLLRIIRICSLATGLFVFGLASVGMARAESCATFNDGTGVLHVPSLNLNGTSYWVDFLLTSPSPIILDVMAFGINGQAGDVATSTFFDSSSNTLTIPCVSVWGLTCWADFTLISSDPLRFQIKGSSCVSAACQPLTTLSQQVQASMRANGTVTGQVGNATLTNLTGQPLFVWIRPGVSWSNASPSRQDLTVIASECIELPANAEVNIAVEGACINAYLDAPNPGDGLAPTVESRSDLVVLTQAIDRWTSYGLITPANNYIAQLAIWVITDNYSLSEIGADPVRQQIRALFRAAGLNPDSYAGLSG